MAVIEELPPTPRGTAGATSSQSDEDIPLDPETEELLNKDKSYVFEGRVSNGAKLKEAGNTYFGRGDIKNALKLYERALFHVTFDEGTWLFELEPKHRDEVSSVIVPVRLNIAACYLKEGPLKDPKAAIEHCNEVLQLDKKNQKALFRRATAQYLRENYDEAKKDLLEAAKTAPSDAKIRQLLKDVEDGIKIQKAKEKNIWGAKLQGATRTDNTEASPPPAPSSSGAQKRQSSKDKQKTLKEAQHQAAQQKKSAEEVREKLIAELMKSPDTTKKTSSEFLRSWNSYFPLLVMLSGVLLWLFALVFSKIQPDGNQNLSTPQAGQSEEEELLFDD